MPAANNSERGNGERGARRRASASREDRQDERQSVRKDRRDERDEQRLRRTARRAAPGANGQQADSTRERILDIALELFTERGYDATSLRDIAERLGTTKAALYYHFERKQDILLELHLRLHALGREVLQELENLEDGQARAAAWPGLIDHFIDQVVENRELFLFHQRNANALERLTDDVRHQAENEDMVEQLRGVLASPAIALTQRVRMACSLGAVVGGLMSGDALFGEVPMPELAELVRAAVHDTLGQ